MKIPKSGPSDSEDSEALSGLKKHCQVVRVKWQFYGAIKTFQDLLNEFYSPSLASTIAPSYFKKELERKVTRELIDEFLSDRIIELSTKEWLTKNPPQLEYDEQEKQIPIAKECDSNTSSSRIHGTKEECQSSDVLQKHAQVTSTGNNPPEGDKEKATHKVKINIDHDYGLEKSPNENAFLFWFQKKYTKILLDGIRIALTEGLPKAKRSQIITAKAGHGKTFIAGAMFRRLIDEDFKHKMNCMSPWPYIYVTKASVVEQVKYDFKTDFNLTKDDVLVVGIDQLRSKFGELFLREKLVVEHREEHYKWEWRAIVHPLLIIWDESHVLKNERSTQSQIGQSFNDIPINVPTFQIHSSATPGITVSNFKVFAVGTRAMWEGEPLSNKRWPEFAQAMCDGLYVHNKNGSEVPAQPQDYCPAATARLMAFLKPYIVRVKGVHPQFVAHDRVKLINFENDLQKTSYESALEDMLQKLAKLHAKEGLSSGEVYMQEITILLYFRMKAELLKAPYLAKKMWQAVNGCDEEFPKKLFAAICALNFKQTISAIVKILINDYNVPRSQISIIWGGGASATQKKEKDKKKLLDGINDPEILEQLRRDGLSVDSLLEELSLDLVEAKEEEAVDPAFRLGVQSKLQREDEKMRFQKGKSLYCLFTYKAGGAGLSLHHTDRFTKEKVRHKPSGYAFEEDIPLIPTRPRRTFASATWSPIEIVQGFGRGPRLTSLSDTYQDLIFFRGTVEERVAKRASMALTCLTQVIREKESWEGLILEGHKHVLHKKFGDIGVVQSEGEEDANDYFETDSDKDDEGDE